MKEWNVGLMRRLGMRFVEVGPDRVVVELEAGEPLTTVGGAVHGGTLMALADTAGARTCGRRASPTKKGGCSRSRSRRRCSSSR